MDKCERCGAFVKHEYESDEIHYTCKKCKYVGYMVFEPTWIYPELDEEGCR